MGWNPYASDYTRYFKPETSRTAIALWAGLGLFLSCALLEIVGAGAGTVASAVKAFDTNPTGGFTGLLATPLADLTLLAIALGAVSANVLNIYSGALSFTAMGIRLPLALRRAIRSGKRPAVTGEEGVADGGHGGRRRGRRGRARGGVSAGAAAVRRPPKCLTTRLLVRA